MHLTISAETVARAAYAISTDATRYYLHGVHFEPHPTGPGVVAVATDGHMLVAAYDPKGECVGLDPSNVIRLDAATIKALRVERGQDERYMTLDAAGEVRVFQDTTVRHIQPGNAVIDGAFPEWRRVLPGGDTVRGMAAAIDAKLLATLGKALAGGSKAQFLQLRHLPDATGDMVPHVAFGAAHNVFAVVMSGKLVTGEALPRWVA